MTERILDVEGWRASKISPMVPNKYSEGSGKAYGGGSETGGIGFGSGNWMDGGGDGRGKAYGAGSGTGVGYGFVPQSWYSGGLHEG